MLIADVRLSIRPDAEAAFLKIMGPFVQESREASGCLDFHMLWVHGELHRAVLLERWRDLASFEAYLGSDAFAVFRERVLPLLSSPPDSAYYEAEVAERGVVR